MPVAEDYHVHIYFDPETKTTAEKVINDLSSRFEVDIGSFHDDPVGPHPMGSCQVTVALENLGTIIDWLAKNRGGLTIFTHANTGDVIKDHSEHTIWMGQMMKLDIDFLKRFAKLRT